MRRLLLLLCTAIIGTTQASPGYMRSELHGQGYNVSLVLPGDPSFDSIIRPCNPRYNFKPAAVAFPTNAQEVSEIVRQGVKSNHRVVARSGGHSFIANGLGGKDGVIVVDLKNFKNITVDPKSGTAVIGTGNRLGDIVTALAAHGRALPHGSCAAVGIGGHAAHGGFGFTSRLWGLTLDTILSIDLVMANGRIITASQRNNPDLFWAMRGAGSSFGIATAITVKTFPAPSSAAIFAYDWHLTADQAASALGAWQNFVLTANLPSELGADIFLSKGKVRGSVGFSLVGAWYKASDQLNATLAPFIGMVPPPQGHGVHNGDYLQSATRLAEGSLETPSPDASDAFYVKSLMTPQNSPMSAAAWKAFVGSLANEGFSIPVKWSIPIELFGGRNSAVNSVKSDATAFVRRDALFLMQFYASAPGNGQDYPQAGFTFMDKLVNTIVRHSPPNWDYGAYTNYADDRLSDWQRRYYGANYPKLRRLKDIYDPKCTFTFPTSIEN